MFKFKERREERCKLQPIWSAWNSGNYLAIRKYEGAVCGNCWAPAVLGEHEHHTIPNSDIPGCGASFRLVAYEMRSRSYAVKHGGILPDDVLEIYTDIPVRYYDIVGFNSQYGASQKLDAKSPVKGFGRRSSPAI